MTKKERLAEDRYWFIEYERMKFAHETNDCDYGTRGLDRTSQWHCTCPDEEE